MNPSFIAIPPRITLSEAQSNFFAVRMKSAFPVVDVQGRLLGMITIKRLRDVDVERRQSMKVEEAMIPREDIVVMQHDRKGDEAAMRMARDGHGKVFVCDEEGRLLGLVTKTDIMSVMRERQEYEKTAAK